MPKQSDKDQTKIRSQINKVIGSLECGGNWSYVDYWTIANKYSNVKIKNDPEYGITLIVDGKPVRLNQEEKHVLCLSYVDERDDLLECWNSDSMKKLDEYKLFGTA